MAQYLKPDSELGYVEDPAEIEFLKFNNLRHSILGCMLGDFDELGAYVVSPEIVKELISMEKYIVQTYDNIELCRSALKLDKQISFMVTFEGNKATLSLIEKLNYEANFTLNSGTYSNINEYVLDSVETSGEVNRNMLYARWNIKTTPCAIVDIFNCDESVLEKYFGIVNRFKYLLKTNAKLLKKENEIEEYEADYAKLIFDILQHYPKLNKAVVEDIKTTLKDKKESISVKKPFFVKTFNELLENSIQKSIGVLTEQEKIDFQQEKRNTVVDLNIKRQSTLEVEEVKTLPEEINELTTKVFQIKLPFEEQKKTLTETAQELVSEHNRVAESLAAGGNEKFESQLIRRTILAVGEKKGNDVELPKEIVQTEKDKLINLLVKMELGDLIGVNIVKEEIVAPQVAEQAKKSDNKKKVSEQNSKVGAIKFANVKYDPPKSKAEKKGEKEESKKAEDEEAKEDNSILNKMRILSAAIMPKPNEEKVVPQPEPTEDFEIEILSNEELESINKRINKLTKTISKQENIEVSKTDTIKLDTTEEGINVN